MNLRNFIKGIYYYSNYFLTNSWIKVYREKLNNNKLYINWKHYKKKHNIQKTIVHYYAVCWNEVEFLPFMFKHYQDSISEFHIYDNESTDGSLEYLNSQNKIHVHSFSTNHQKDLSKQMYIKNNMWKNSRGKADYVIVCDIDELLHIKEGTLNNYFNLLNKKGITLIKPSGYDMISKDYPIISIPLLKQVNKGIEANEFFSKCILFDPYKIIDINYGPGSHQCYPVGKIKFDYSSLLLHFKYLSFNHLLNRTHDYKKRGSDHTQKNISVHYKYSDDKLKRNFDEKINEAKKILE